jgi:hypothetical protein
MAEPEIANIPESYFEYRADFKIPLFDWWRQPNQVIEALYQTLKPWNVNLGNAFWEKDPKTIREAQIGFSVERLSAVIKVGIETAVFSSVNPDWEGAEQLISLFDLAMSTIRTAGKAEIATQEALLAMHVRQGSRSLREVMEGLVSAAKLGPGRMYGVSVYGDETTLLLDKSQKYTDAVFIRVSRKFSASAGFDAIAEAIYSDEMRALGYFGLGETRTGV